MLPDNQYIAEIICLNEQENLIFMDIPDGDWSKYYFCSYDGNEWGLTTTFQESLIQTLSKSPNVGDKVGITIVDSKLFAFCEVDAVQHKPTIDTPEYRLHKGRKMCYELYQSMWTCSSDADEIDAQVASRLGMDAKDASKFYRMDIDTLRRVYGILKEIKNCTH